MILKVLFIPKEHKLSNGLSS